MGGISHFLGNLLGGGDDPAEAANQYYSQVSDILREYLGPYVSRGNQVYPQLKKQYDQLMNDPEGLLNKLGQGYQSSPGYQFQVNQATQSANSAAAAGGMLGSPAHQQNVSTMVNNLASQGYNQYLGNVLNMYGRGLSEGQSIYNTGARMSSNLGENLANVLMNQGNLAYANTVNQNQSWLGFLGDLLSVGALTNHGQKFLNWL